MKIALVISSLNAGGAERILTELANHWASQSHQVTIVTLASPKSRPFYPLNPHINLIQLDQSNHQLSAVVRFKNIFRRIFCLRKAIRRLNSDVVVSFVTEMNITTLLATWKLNIPVMISERIDPNFHSLPKLYSWLRFKIYPYCSRLIMQTESAASYFPASFKKIIRIIPNAVSLPKSQKGSYNSKVQRIVSIGRLTLQKDHATLIRAFSQINKDFPHLTLTIYGEGNERSNLENIIDSLNLQKCVFLPGIVNNTYDILREADLFIFPSRYEGFPNALCEAMAVGLPVIASDCSGNVDIMREGIDGRLFPKGNTAALTRIICELMSDSKQRDLIGKNAKDVCERFSPDRIYHLWDEEISKIMRART